MAGSSATRPRSRLRSHSSVSIFVSCLPIARRPVRGPALIASRILFSKASRSGSASDGTSGERIHIHLDS